MADSYVIGRAWTYKELSVKSFEDLHKLYWVCVKEQNKALTREKERTRLRAGYGELENQEKIDVVSFDCYSHPLSIFYCTPFIEWYHDYEPIPSLADMNTQGRLNPVGSDLILMESFLIKFANVTCLYSPVHMIMIYTNHITRHRSAQQCAESAKSSSTGNYRTIKPENCSPSATLRIFSKGRLSRTMLEWN